MSELDRDQRICDWIFDPWDGRVGFAPPLGEINAFLDVDARYPEGV